jgi:hypothetical protein
MSLSPPARGLSRAALLAFTLLAACVTEESTAPPTPPGPATGAAAPGAPPAGGPEAAGAAGGAPAGAPGAAPGGAPPGDPSAAGGPAGGAGVVVVEQKLNLNTATADQFKAAIPNFGDKMAHEFEEYRPYVSIEQFRKEMAKYVDANAIYEYERYVYVPVHRNDSDAATLAQLPGVDPAFAEQLIAGRPYADDAAFVTALQGKINERDLKAALSMMVQP